MKISSAGLGCTCRLHLSVAPGRVAIREFMGAILSPGRVIFHYYPLGTITSYNDIMVPNRSFCTLYIYSHYITIIGFWSFLVWSFTSTIIDHHQVTTAPKKSNFQDRETDDSCVTVPPAKRKPSCHGLFQFDGCYPIV